MIIDKLLSPAIRLPLSGLAVATAILTPPGSGQSGIMDFQVARNNGLIFSPFGPAWDINVRGATSGGAATLTLNLLTSAAANMSSPVTLFTTGALALAALNKFDREVIIPDTDQWLRYVAWQVTVGTAVFTGGTLSIEFAEQMRKYRAYPAQGNR